MTKKELIEALEPFDDECTVMFIDSIGPVDIADYVGSRIVTQADADDNGDLEGRIGESFLTLQKY
jgi:hypothetical protein